MQMDFRTVSETVSERIVRCQPQLVVLVVMDVEKASCWMSQMEWNNADANRPLLNPQELQHQVT